MTVWGAVARGARPQLRAPGFVVAALLAAAVVGALSPLEPGLAVGLIVAAIVAIVVAVDLGSLPVFLVFTMFVESLQLGPGLRIGRVAGALALAVVALRLLDRGRGGLRANALLVTAGAFGLWIVTSAFWAGDTSLVWTQVTSYVLAIAYMLALAVLVRTRKQLRAILATLAFGSVVFGIVSLVQYASTNGARASALQGDPNYFATYQVIALPAALALAATERRRGLRNAYFGVVVVIVLSVVSSLSRTGLVALTAVVVATLVLPWRWSFRKPGQKLTYATVLALAAAGAAALGSSELMQRIQTVLDPTKSAGDRGSGRTDLWSAALRGWHEHPFRGIGAGNFQAQSLDLLQTTPGVNTAASWVQAGRVVHNSYLEVLTELGVVGLAIFVLLILLSARAFWHAYRRAGRAGDVVLARFSTAALLSLFGFTLAAFFLSIELGKAIWVLVGLALAVDVIARNLPVQAPAPAYSQKVTGPFERDSELEERRLTALRRDQERIDRRRAALDERERQLRERERTVDRAAWFAAPSQPSLRRWRVDALEQLVAGADGAAAQLDRWRKHLAFLRSEADAEGLLPASFDPLVRKVFGRLLDGARRGS